MIHRDTCVIHRDTVLDRKLSQKRIENRPSPVPMDTGTLGPYPYSVSVSVFRIRVRWAGFRTPYPYPYSVSASWARFRIPYPYPYSVLLSHECKCGYRSRDLSQHKTSHFPIRIRIRIRNTDASPQSGQYGSHPKYGPHPIRSVNRSDRV